MTRKAKAVAGLLGVASFALFFSSGALALDTHVFSTSFATSGPGDGQVSSPQGVAVNSTSHDVYVADTGNARIDQFDSTGTFIRAFGADVGGAGINTCTTGCVAGTPGTGPGAFTTPTFVAVDNDASSASFHDVYVADTADNLVTKFDSSGALITAWGSGGQLDGSTATDGPFGSISGVAVDASGNLLVHRNAFAGPFFKFAENGSFSTDFSTVRGTLPNGLAVDSAGNFFKVNGDQSVEKLDSSGNDIGQVTASDLTTGLAVDSSSGDLYVDNGGASISHYAFDGSGDVIEPDASTCPPGDFAGCTATDTFGTGHLSGAGGLAVDPTSQDLYAADTGNSRLDIFTPVTLPDVTTGAATNIGPNDVTLNGHVDPAGGPDVTDCHFDWGTDTSYGHTAACLDSTDTIVGTPGNPITTPTDVHADLTGLTGGTTYHFRLEASNASGPNFGADATFATPPPPSIDAASAIGITATSADLTAQINPNGADTTYHFSYGTDTSYGTDVPFPDADIGSGTTDVAVSQHISGLTSDTTYHWRVVATSANGTTVGADHTFIYDTTGGGLPDGRAYEMVTPPQKNGALVGDILFGVGPSFSRDGSRLIVSSAQCFADPGSCTANRGTVGTPFAFTRTAAGWDTTPLAPPATQLDSNTNWLNSADAGTALFSAPTPPQGEDDLYARRPDGTFAQIGPLTPPAAGAQGPVGNDATAATADLSHVVYEFADAPAVWPFDATTSAALYEYSGTCGSPTACEAAQPLLVGVSGGPGSTDLISTCGNDLGGNTSDGALSGDGRIVYFTARPCASGSGANSGTPVPADTLYARIDGDLPTAHTVPISQRSPADCSGACLTSPPSGASFQGASPADGSRAYFTSTQQLTDAASQDPLAADSAIGSIGGCAQTSGANGCNLYLYDFSQPAGQELTAVSAGDTSGAGPRVQGVMAISSDGSHVYFVARGVLTADPNAQGQTAQNGADNLYAFDAATGDTSFVAALPGSDSETWRGAISKPNVTPDGRFLVFTSRGALTPDTGAAGVQQIFRYDAQTAQLDRISIGNDGFNDNGNHPANTLCSSALDCPEAAYIAPRVPDGRDGQAGPFRSDPTMSDDGARVFFQSPVGLTPQALSDVRTGTDPRGNPTYAQNVYQWHAGHVSLISDGRDASATTPVSGCPLVFTAVCLIGADATGDNVFFTSADQLVPTDTDTQVDFYDARVGGGFPAVPPPAPCSGDNCKPPPSGAPPLQSPTSSAVNGPADPTPSRQPARPSKKCKKHKKGKKCRKARHANTTRRAGR